MASKAVVLMTTGDVDVWFSAGKIISVMDAPANDDLYIEILKENKAMLEVLLYGQKLR